MWAGLKLQTLRTSWGLFVWQLLYIIIWQFFLFSLLGRLSRRSRSSRVVTWRALRDEISGVEGNYFCRARGSEVLLFSFHGHLMKSILMPSPKCCRLLAPGPLIALVSFHSNSLNMAKTRKRADGWDNGADSQSVYLPVRTNTRARA